MGEFNGWMDLGGGPLFAGEASVPPRFEDYSGGFLAKFSWSGQHLWSRAIQSYWGTRIPMHAGAVATDSQGRILVGGFAGRESDLGEGPLDVFGPFIARYDVSGQLLWKRLFEGAYGQVTAVRPLGGEEVGFLAEFAGTFTFAGERYTASDETLPWGPYDTRSFFGTLSAPGGDGWLRAMGDGSWATRLLADEEQRLTVAGVMGGHDLGGGSLGHTSSLGAHPFLARYSRSGVHLWSRIFDRHLAADGADALQLVLQPGGTSVLGSDFSAPVELEGVTYTPRGPSDLLYLQLAP